MLQPSIRILSLETPHSFFRESHSFNDDFIESIYKTQKIDFIRI